MADQTTEFGDIDQREEQYSFNLKLRGAIRDLAKQLRHPVNKRILLEFIDVMNFTKYTDESILPYYSDKGQRAHTKNRSACLFAAVSYVVQKWWGYQHQKVSSKEIEKLIKHLVYTAEVGLGQYEVTGDVKEGYTLKRKR